MAHTPLAPLSGAVIAALLIFVAPASASNWTVTLRSGSSAEAQAQAAPPAPTGVSDLCVASNQQKITVSWNAVTHATTYTVYKSTSTTSSPGAYTSTATGVATTTWTSAALTAANNYWFEVAAYFGTKWLGAQSATTGETTIATNSCIQP